MELRDWANQPRDADGKFAGGGGAKTAAEAAWIAKGEAAWAKHEAAKKAGKPSLASYYKKQATQAKATAKAHHDNAVKAEAPKAPPARLPDEMKLADLLSKHKAAKDADKPSLASYYKKKAAEHQSKMEAGQGKPPEAPKPAQKPPKPEPKVSAPPSPWTHPTTPSADKKLADLIKKHADAKAAGKPSLASYYKKKVAEHKAANPQAAEAPKPNSAEYFQAKADKWKATDPELAKYYQDKADTAKAAASNSEPKTDAEAMAAYYQAKAHEAMAKGDAESAVFYQDKADKAKGAEAATGPKPSKEYSGHWVDHGGNAPPAVQEYVDKASKDQPVQGDMVKLNSSVTSAAKRPDDVQSAVKSYTGSGYSTINNALRGNSLMTSATKAKILKIDQAMQPIEKTIQVRRNTGNPKTFEGLKAGDIISDAGFHSTSVAGSFGGTHGRSTMHIIVPKGAKAAWVKPISLHAGENEMVLPRGQKYVVLKDVVVGANHSDIQLMAIPESVLPGVNTKQAHAGKPYSHDLRAMLLQMADEALNELRTAP